TSVPELSQIIARNTYICIRTDVHNACTAEFLLPLHWTLTASLEAAPTPVAPMGGDMAARMAPGQVGPAI
ncbi:hypothetical protein KIPB_012830, partial [Kipferlia bialata]